MKRLITIIAFTFLFIGACTNKIVYKKFQRGVNYYNEYNYAKALKTFEKALKYPGKSDYDSLLTHYSGVVAYDAKEYEKAVEYLKKSIESNYNKYEALLLITQVLNELGRTTEAKKYLIEGFDLYPDSNSYFMLELITVYLQNKRLP